MADTKVYVPVVPAFDKNGFLLPLKLTWEDGCTYIIDRVLDIRPAAAMKAGGQGNWYTINVNGWQSYLFFEETPQLPEIISDAGLLSGDKDNSKKAPSYTIL